MTSLCEPPLPDLPPDPPALPPPNGNGNPIGGIIGIPGVPPPVGNRSGLGSTHRCGSHLAGATSAREPACDNASALDKVSAFAILRDAGDTPDIAPVYGMVFDSAPLLAAGFAREFARERAVASPVAPAIDRAVARDSSFVRECDFSAGDEMAFDSDLEPASESGCVLGILNAVKIPRGIDIGNPDDLLPVVDATAAPAALPTTVSHADSSLPSYNILL